MLAIFGAEVVGAEILAAEAAAAAAAEAAAIEAARVAAVEVAAQEAARQAAAQTAINSGITSIPDPNAVASVVAPPASTTPFTPAPASVPAPAPPITPPSAPYSPLELTNNPSVTPFTEYFGSQAAPPPPTPSTSPMGLEGQIPANQFIEPGSGGINSVQNTIAQANVPVTPPSGLEAGFDKALKFAEKNPFTAMTLAYTGANALGLMNPSGATFNQEKYNGPLSKYKLSPNFQPGSANPADFQYRPRYAAGGGIMGTESYDIPVGYDEGGDVPEYARGGSLSDSIESYQKMLAGKPQAAPARSANVGIYYDQDPDTRYQDALTAAQIRQAKVNQRAYVSPPAAKRPEPLGKLNMPTSAKSKGDVEAASGGIMQSSLGGYAAGGNPRLLKGPGDGMSDNIPATINRRQPARLADGEFVIPADVVSHLGNGSTEAGAKQLHAMMNKVRKARTGNPKQGKQIKPQKYMPK
jgi:type II secretory pathway pseudopilin PulG